MSHLVQLLELCIISWLDNVIVHLCLLHIHHSLYQLNKREKRTLICLSPVSDAIAAAAISHAYLQHRSKLPSHGIILARVLLELCYKSGDLCKE